MKALITGASSGIGQSIAKYLSNLGYDLVLVASNKEKLEATIKDYKTNVKLVVTDLSNLKMVKDLYLFCRDDNIDILVNNAGFGLIGNFNETDSLRELEMIDVNIKAVHLLTKLFLKDMIKKDYGYILNVSSIAAFNQGPLMATYYATKAYSYKLSVAIYEELRRNKSNVHISCLCPGPVETNFNKVANVKFAIKGISSDYVAKYAVDKMFESKLIIVPSLKMKLLRFISHFISDKANARFAYRIQKKK
ncbi:MAG: SDR family NAD(P)-dependent oxidoreductase [Tenericutes bacterium]|jgi:short-subunit dehydrogenase|nr:SDR family NAD(P)-dependent oxidoreductase [Mycoplasmatota bacterium]